MTLLILAQGFGADADAYTMRQELTQVVRNVWIRPDKVEAWHRINEREKK